MITDLLLLSNQIKSQKVPFYKRFLYEKIDFQERLIGLLGSKGAGKTTILLQYLKEVTAKDTLYIIADHPAVAQKGIFYIADEFQKIGGKVLIIDEIHKIKDISNSFTVADDIEVGFKNKIPLWLFGFLY